MHLNPAVTSIDEVAVQLRALQGVLPRGDGVRYFNRLYLEVTEAVIERLARGDFEDPAFLEGLDVSFSNAYFRALVAAEQAPRSVSKAWAPLIEARRRKRVAPIQFALAGVNAHVNLDLAVAVVKTSEALGVTVRDGTAQQRDFDRINGMIASAQESAKAWLFSGVLRRLDRLVGRVDDVVATWSIERARDAAWLQAKVMWELRDEPQLLAAHQRTLADTVGFAGRGLLVPSIPGLQRWADLFRDI